MFPASRREDGVNGDGEMRVRVTAGIPGSGRVSEGRDSRQLVWSVVVI